MHRKVFTVWPDEARDAFDKALACYERKQNLAMVAQVQPERDALGERAPV